MTASGKLAADTKGNNIRFLENQAVTKKRRCEISDVGKGILPFLSPRTSNLALQLTKPAIQMILLYCIIKNFIYQLCLGIKEIWRLYWQNTHTHPFNGPFSRTTRVSRYQKGKTNLDFTEARDCQWQWHQLGHMQLCISLQTDNHASTPPLSFLQARCPSCCPTNSVKALKAKQLVKISNNLFSDMQKTNLKYMLSHF